MDKSFYLGVDLFAGAAGLSYGFSKAGFDMKLGIESDPNVAYTLKMNNKDMNVIVNDIRIINPLEALKQSGIVKKDVCLIAGGPPCRGFSQSNCRTRNINNPLNSLYNEYFRFVKTIRPPVFILENVSGLKTLNKGQVLREILKIGRKLGYFVQYDTVDAKNFGVPQRRRRIVFIGTEKKADSFFDMRINKIVTVRDAIDDLPELENGNSENIMEYLRYTHLSEYQKTMRRLNGKKAHNNLVTKNNELVVERYKHIPPGGNWRNVPKRLMKNYKDISKCHGWIYYRLKWDEPSVVINNFRKNMLIHPDQNRGLSVREAARIQSFPDHYKFYGGLTSQQQQVANAVPPLLAEKIGKKIIKYMADDI